MLDWVGIAATIGAATGLLSVAKDFFIPRWTAKRERRAKERDEILVLLFEHMTSMFHFHDNLLTNLITTRDVSSVLDSSNGLSVMGRTTSLMYLTAVRCDAAGVECKKWLDATDALLKQYGIVAEHCKEVGQLPSEAKLEPYKLARNDYVLQTSELSKRVKSKLT